MLIRSKKYWFLFVIFSVIVFMGASNAPAGDRSYGFSEGYKGIAKTKPSTAGVLKVRPSGLSSRFRGLSSFNPANWGLNCYLPAPAKGQFLLGPELFFSRFKGEARRGLVLTGLDSTTVDFDDNLGFSGSGNTLWSIKALYQFRPRLAVTYSFMPISLEATGTSLSGFQFGGQAFTAGASLHSKFDRYEHRAGLVFNVSRRSNAVTSLFAQWLYIQDRLMIKDSAGLGTAATWDDDKNLALVGVQFNKCLKNYHGNTLALNIQGGVSFLDDTMGYEAEAGLSYLIPIKRGRFGFLKGGYRYSHLKKETDLEMLGTTLDGAFLQLGFLF
jgi:hypothetical protein